MKCIISLFTVAVCSIAIAQEQTFPDDWFWREPFDRAPYDAMVGKQMPKLHLAEWVNGELKRDDLKGKIVLIDFWATWCVPCIVTMPKLNALHEKYQEQGVIVLGICTAENQERMEAVLNRQKVVYPNAKDPENKTAAAWNVTTVEMYPTYALIDREGKVRGVGLDSDRLEAAIQKLLEEQPLPAD
jgi:cytochrome c biogenesis protein CcmG, thiol:disulfide interchange protein DsbE